MLEEAADKLRIVSDFVKLLIDLGLELLALLQGPARHTGSLGVASDQLIRIEVRRIARQKVQREFALRAGHVLLDDGFLVSR